MTLETCRGTQFYVIYIKKIMYQVGINKGIYFLCFAGHASRYNHVKKNQHDTQLILHIFCQPLRVSGLDTAETCRGKRFMEKISDKQTKVDEIYKE
jgi:hypothetical protein